MNTQSEKLSLIKWISSLEDSKMLKTLREIKSEYIKSEDWWETLKEEEKNSIKRGLKDAEEGKTHSYDVAQDIYGKYL